MLRHPAPEASTLIKVASAIMIIWSIFITVVVQNSITTAVWVGDLSKVAYTPEQALLFSFLQPALLLFNLLGLLIRNPRHRAIAAALAITNLISIFLLIPRVIFEPMAIFAPALTRSAILLSFGAILWGITLRHGTRFSSRNILVALIFAAPFALPWVRLGGLGSMFDIGLAALQAIAIATFASGLLMAVLHPHLGQSATTENRQHGWDLLYAGLTMAAALTMIGGTFGQDDYQSLLMPVLSAIAFPMVALALPEGRHAPDLLGPWLVAVLIAMLPLAFSDPEEIALIVALSDDTFKYTQSAAFWDLLIGLILWGVLQGCATRLPRLATPAPLAIAAALLWGGIGAAYATSPQIGLYGNSFFVVMKEQADLSTAAGISDLTERRRFVYTTLVETADRSQADLRAFLDQQGVTYTPFYLTNGVEVQGDELLKWQIANRPDVDRVIFSQTLRPVPQPQSIEEGYLSTPTEAVWSVADIGATDVWDEFGVRGEGIVIGQSDSGVDWQHPALSGSYRGNQSGGVSHDYNWLDPWTGRAEPWDGNGHGTHTLGTVLGSTGTGVAPGATWFGCANLVRNIGNPPDYLHCMQFMLAPYPIGGNPLRDGDPARAADVSTNSWGCPPIEGCDSSVLLPAARAMRAAGIFFVVAAGNEGSACDSLRTPPGNLAAAISVGAIDDSGNLTSFSSRGPNTASPDGRTGPTILAPGAGVISAWPGGGYTANDGTSMATPHVAGVVALMWSANPALRGNVDRTEQILIETARPYTGSLEGCGGKTSGDSPGSPNPESGYGIIDAYAAVAQAIEEK